MKKLILVLMLSAFGIIGFGQHETLFNQFKIRGAFGGPIIESGFQNGLGTSVGGGGGIVFNNMFVGFYGMGGADFNKIINGSDVEVLNIGHGGLWIGANFPSHKLFHFYGSVRTGWGALNVEFDDVDRYSDIDKIFVVTPEIGLEVNVTHWFRVAATAGYRWIDGANTANGYTDKDFTGTVGTLSFRFGWFGWKRW